MILKSKRIILRPMRISDAVRFAKWSYDTGVNKFVARQGFSVAAMRAWIRSIPKKKNAKDFAIDTADGTHIGSIGLHTINTKDKNASYHILIGDKNYWNKGYGTEATKLILDYGFKKLKLHRIWLGVFSFNKRAIHTYKKLGFKHEGTEREYVFYRKKFHDSYLMGLLDREWKKQNKRS